MQLHLERDSGVPLHRQIELEIRSRIDAGDLRVGDRLPASRRLARALGVNRATVTAAFEALAAAGLVEATVGRGTEVIRSAARTGSEPAPVRPTASAPPDWAALLSGALDARGSQAERVATRGVPVPGGFDFTALVPDEALFPTDRLRRCLDEVLRRDGSQLLQYGPPAGHASFRELLAQRMRRAGMQVDADDVIIVNGAQQGLDLFCRALLDAGDVVAVESPTYANLLPVLRLHRAEIHPLPMTPSGLDCDRLESLLEARPVKFLYTMPHFQNPTGITSTLPHRKRLLEIAARHRLTILEDGYEEDLRWDGGEMLPLRALDDSGRVCYLGTFSKGLVPGFRIGWLVAHRDLLVHIAHLKRTTDYHTPLVLQAALEEFCRRGDYDAHLRRLRRTYRTRMAAATAAFEKHLPPDVRWRVPQGGYCLWVELPARIPVDELLSRLARDGVHVTPGRHFFANEPEFGCFRMSISRTNEEQIEAGIGILGRHLRDLAREPERGESRLAAPYV